MTAAPKFTPGPWRATSDDFIVAGNRGLHVASVCTIGMGASVLPNARLIAAAPELYEACRSIVGVFEGHDDAPIYVQKARAALAKVAPHE